MFNSKLLVVLLASLVALLPLSLQADNDEVETSELSALQWLNKDKAFNDWCNQNPLVSNTKVFPDTLVKVKKIRFDYCNKKIASFAELQARIVDLLNDLGRLFPVSNLHLHIYSLELVRINKTGEVGVFEVIDDPLLAISLGSGSASRIENDVLKNCDESAKKFAANTNCKSALNDFKFIYNFAQATLSQPIAFELSKHLGDLEMKWNDFYNQSKSQTIWEMTINGAMFQKDNKEHKFAAPPSWQLVVMHPTVVVENVKDAIDGDQLKEALMIELVGADWWQQNRWYLPSGASLVAAYSDRSGVDDWGYGLALNFESKFTLGAADHDGELGIFMTIDLLKLVQDKASIIKSYRESVNF